LGDDSGEDNENEESNPMEGFGKEKEDERFFEQESMRYHVSFELIDL
jgi:hypothetical protein